MRKSSAFTLIELVIVIAIIGILASLAFPKFIDMSLESKISAGKAGLGTLRATLATRYAASATAGATASYPTLLVASDFAGGVLPKNPVNGQSGAEAVDEPMHGAFSANYGYWYISTPGGLYGEAGAYTQDGIDAGDW